MGGQPWREGSYMKNNFLFHISDPTSTGKLLGPQENTLSEVHSDLAGLHHESIIPSIYHL